MVNLTNVLCIFIFVIFNLNVCESNPILEEAKSFHPWISSVRRELHKIPELMYEEVKTSAFIRKTLDEIGVRYTFPVAVTGIVAEVGQGSPVVALRADFDALPLTEGADVDFKSEHEGRMHACGHDAHTAMLLGAARILKARESSLSGTVRLLFQPAEEGGAGAKRMIGEGALGDAGAIFAVHVTPGFGGALLPLGHISTNTGTILAGAGQFDIVISGAGGHAAAPHQTRDPVLASAAVVQALQQVVARTLDPLQSGVISITYIQGGTTYNVIPAEVKLGGTFRALTHETFAFLEKQVEKVATATAAAYGCEAGVFFKDGVEVTSPSGTKYLEHAYPPTVNNAALTAFAKTVSALVVGEDKLSFDEKPVMGGEDFSFYAEKIPGFFAFLGHATEGHLAPNHSPYFNVDEDVLPIGTALHVSYAIEWLSENKAKLGGKQEL